MSVKTVIFGTPCIIYCFLSKGFMHTYKGKIYVFQLGQHHFYKSHPLVYELWMKNIKLYNNQQSCTMRRDQRTIDCISYLLPSLNFGRILDLRIMQPEMTAVKLMAFN